MISALVSLLVIFAAARIVISAFRAFFAWLGRGIEVRWLVQGNYIDTRYAAELHEFIDQVEESAARRAFSYEPWEKRPRLSFEQLRALGHAHSKARELYLHEVALNWYQIVIIFLLGSFIGLILEQIWMFITAGLTESRVGLVWGPYSPIYGFGAVLLTLVCWNLKKHVGSDLAIFVASLGIGGALEQLTGWGMETFLGVVSWDYSGTFGALTKWVSIPFLLMWGLLGLVWSKHIMPELLYRIGMPTTTRQALFVSLLGVYLALDITMTVACFSRMAQRDAGRAPQNAFEQWVDNHYTDEFIAARFQNMMIEGTGT
ncbi:MAG: putative ABC transporter permease [Atopobiaceae bacterium]|nr:putative ABC transporter permease [Atopobiaceae bacterium]